jgi:hypothetical protein
MSVGRQQSLARSFEKVRFLLLDGSAPHFDVAHQASVIE